MNVPLLNTPRRRRRIALPRPGGKPRPNPAFQLTGNYGMLYAAILQDGSPNPTARGSSRNRVSRPETPTTIGGSRQTECT